MVKWDVIAVWFVLLVFSGLFYWFAWQALTA